MFATFINPFLSSPLTWSHKRLEVQICELCVELVSTWMDTSNYNEEGIQTEKREITRDKKRKGGGKILFFLFLS